MDKPATVNLFLDGLICFRRLICGKSCKNAHMIYARCIKLQVIQHSRLTLLIDAFCFNFRSSTDFISTKLSMPKDIHHKIIKTKVEIPT